MDPLSDLLSLLHPREPMFRGLDASGDWAIDYEASEGIKCFALLSGACRLTVDGFAEPLRFAAGDCVLLPGAAPFSLSGGTAAGVTAIDAGALFSAVPAGSVAVLNGGGDCFGMGGYFEFDGRQARLLLDLLPPIVHIREEADREALRWCIDRLMRELRDPMPGGALVIGHLAHMLLVQALRLQTADASGSGIGWLSALADRQLAAAIGAMHREPARRWTLVSLAGVAGMSRSSFAEAFKDRVGLSAIDYLTRWRMLIAGDRLVHSREPIAVIAPALGYESESAFSTAFKRVMGCSPRQYGKHATERSDAPPSPAAVEP